MELDNLEKRNHELATLLEQHSQLNSQHSIQLDELKQQNGRLQQTLETERKSYEEKMKRELGALKEQLQVHIQTIGILVAEKTELQSSVNQNSKLAEARQSEIEELSGRLKASRQRVTDLERNFSSANNSSQKNEKSNKELSKDLEKQRLDLYRVNKSNEEFQQHNAELQGKLQQKITESARMEDELIELRGKLEITELFVQQLQSGKDLPDRSTIQQMDNLVMEKTELQTKLHQQEQVVSKLVAEQGATELQFRQYMEQLQQQLHNFQTQAS
jgi:chromosome segregation ATPase